MLVKIYNMYDTNIQVSKKSIKTKVKKISIKSIDKEYHIHYTKSIKSKERKF